MKKSILKSTTLFSLLLFPAFVFGLDNVGVIDGIWFSKSEAVVDETIQIFAGIQNQTDEEFQGTISFFDSDKSIGTADFSIGAGDARPVFIDYKLDAGNHLISATIESSKTHDSASVSLKKERFLPMMILIVMALQTKMT